MLLLGLRVKSAPDYRRDEPPGRKNKTEKYAAMQENIST